jgi:hypothetical protein
MDHQNLFPLTVRLGDILLYLTRRFHCVHQPKGALSTHKNIPYEVFSPFLQTKIRDPLDEKQNDLASMENRRSITACRTLGNILLHLTRHFHHVHQPKGALSARKNIPYEVFSPFL